MKSRTYTIVIAFILGWAAPARAQTTSGTITGIVTDPSNAVVPGAQITLTNRATGLQRETLASDAGEYRVPLLPPGLYTIKVEATGFKTEVVKDVKLETLQTARVDFRLELGDVREVMTVEGRTPLLETEATGSRTRAEAWFNRYDKMPAELTAALGSVKDVPVDIQPVFAFKVD